MYWKKWLFYWCSLQVYVECTQVLNLFRNRVSFGSVYSFAEFDKLAILVFFRFFLCVSLLTEDCAFNGKMTLVDFFIWNYKNKKNNYLRFNLIKFYFHWYVFILRNKSLYLDFRVTYKFWFCQWIFAVLFFWKSQNHKV